MKKLGLLALAAVFVLGMGVSAHAAFTLPTSPRPILGADFKGPTTDFTNGSWSLGWSFTVGNTPLSLQSLGFYSGSTGVITESHDVGVFDFTGTRIASATVTPNDPLNNSWWRWNNLASPVVLAAGGTYTVAAETGGDNYTWDPKDLMVNPYITLNGNRFAFGSALTLPTRTDGADGYFGPNIAFTPVPVPPSLLLLAPGLLGLAGFRRRFAG